MKILKKSATIVVLFALISLFVTSCGSAKKYGCPGQDRPSFRGVFGSIEHSIITPLHANKVSFMG